MLVFTVASSFNTVVPNSNFLMLMVTLPTFKKYFTVSLWLAKLDCQFYQLLYNFTDCCHLAVALIFSKLEAYGTYRF